MFPNQESSQCRLAPASSPRTHPDLLATSCQTSSFPPVCLPFFFFLFFLTAHKGVLPNPETYRSGKVLSLPLTVTRAPAKRLFIARSLGFNEELCRGSSCRTRTGQN